MSVRNRVSSAKEDGKHVTAIRWSRVRDIAICSLSEILFAIGGKFLAKFLVVIRTVRYQRRSLTEVPLYVIFLTH